MYITFYFQTKSVLFSPHVVDNLIRTISKVRTNAYENSIYSWIIKDFCKYRKTQPKLGVPYKWSFTLHIPRCWLHMQL